MQLINQHAKRIMEECKVKARAAGLRFGDETLEYIVTNRQMVDLKPRIFIPTLYDYWVHDVETLKARGSYQVFPHNAYETVVNTRPTMSFYNDNNPDWLNVMIFYHVLGHIDFFQNNVMYRHTWSDDFSGQALADKRVIAGLRSEHGRWLDYVIEFSRGIDNLVGYYETLAELNEERSGHPTKTDFFFDTFLQNIKKVRQSEYLRYLDLYNELISGEQGEQSFFREVTEKYPELGAEFERYIKERRARPSDLLEFIMENSTFLNRRENEWMKEAIVIVRRTSLYFQPQIRDHILNEGWATYWHERLFIEDDRVRGNEVKYAKIHADVTALNRMGINPYAIGMRLLQHIEDMAEKGRYSYDYQRTRSMEEREKYDLHTGNGTAFLFKMREELNDFSLISRFVDQEFVDRHKLFVAGKRFNSDELRWEWYIKSRKAEDYKQMLIGQLYHPPHITVDEAETGETLSLVHHFEGKRLVPEYIPATMIGIEYLWGRPVKLKTHENYLEGNEERWRHVIYTSKDRKVTKDIGKHVSPEVESWFKSN
ncbi:SpoVR family protein [Candidatus Woesearchaeota archaeon]|nr:SpoVR family protein [Candidatus Woesearchaeota archaeon]